ncbi:Transmembrane family 220, helix [Maribacter sedimenticola]|uniref:Transmembrane family 220, helix n=1 Tax=Maribacter sedimenticola TaxID=228956 RepID=A0ABY1SES7_9FLAO|nr:transmembrane 220 family protein [Maribacter sedimenticola]SNR39073.1 Transmembrane family 220, helix [Maribacter sedimenticola]
MKVLFKILGYVFAILFAVGAILQYNDPDAMLWVAIYVIAAAISLAFAVQKIGFKPLILMGIFCCVGFLYLYPSNFQGFDLNDGDIKTVELGREAFGLLIIGVVFLIFGFRVKSKL